MKLEVFEGKTEEEAKNKAAEGLNVSLEKLLYTKEEVKAGLFKGTIIRIQATTLENVTEYLKEYLGDLLGNMDIEATFESKVRDDQITIKMYSNNNGILIGKNGQTLQALQTVLRQVVQNQIGIRPYILLDVENYKDKQNAALERLAKNIGREVLKTKREVKMDNMNAYERRIVHNALASFEKLETISEGEEPHRHIIVKLKEDK